MQALLGLLLLILVSCLEEVSTSPVALHQDQPEVNHGTSLRQGRSSYDSMLWYNNGQNTDPPKWQFWKWWEMERNGESDNEFDLPETVESEHDSDLLETAESDNEFDLPETVESEHDSDLLETAESDNEFDLPEAVEYEHGSDLLETTESDNELYLTEAVESEYDSDLLETVESDNESDFFENLESDEHESALLETDESEDSSDLSYTDESISERGRTECDWTNMYDCLNGWFERDESDQSHINDFDSNSFNNVWFIDSGELGTNEIESHEYDESVYEENTEEYPGSKHKDKGMINNMISFWHFALKLMLHWLGF